MTLIKKGKYDLQKFVYDNDTINVSMTFGVAEYSSAELSIDELIRRADVALYDGKERGKDCVVVFSG